MAQSTTMTVRLDEIYRYTRDRWGEEQAERCITGLFEGFERIDSPGVASSPVPAEFGVDGFFFRCGTQVRATADEDP